MTKIRGQEAQNGKYLITSERKEAQEKTVADAPRSSSSSNNDIKSLCQTCHADGLTMRPELPLLLILKTKVCQYK